MTRRFLRWGLAGVALLAVASCAKEPPADDPDAVAEFQQTNDPLEPMNRAIFDFNDELQTVFLGPVARGYRAVVPPFGRDRIADFLDNLGAPVVFLNDVLQGNVALATKTLERFALNSSFGVFGIMDVAKPMGIPDHDAGFGQTLGVWGVGEGPYLVLPFFGPSNPRDAVGLGVDFVSDPWGWYLQDQNLNYLNYVRFGVTAVSQEEAYLDFIDDLRRTSLDYYATMRSLYRQRRHAAVEAGKHDVEISHDRHRLDQNSSSGN
jgi:phospholipid-binding lipoprotein MlaA